MTIYESRHFIVHAPEAPLVDRNDGGHIVIDPRQPVSDRQQLTPIQAIELMRLTIVAGAAMTMVMNRHGVDIGRINYQDNGNWSVFKPEGAMLHIHLYGRAKHATIQKYGQTLHMPHRDDYPELYANLKPLEPRDVQEIRAEIIALLENERYSDKEWNLDRT